jgi:hypothetical protein
MTTAPSPPNRRRRRIVVAIVAVAYVLAFAAAVYQWHAPAWQFERSIVAGMSKSDVQKAVGEPAQVLNAGERLATWGNDREHEVHVETWIYFVWPGSQNRFVLEFEGDRVKSVVRQAN